MWPHENMVGCIWWFESVWIKARVFCRLVRWLMEISVKCWLQITSHAKKSANQILRISSSKPFDRKCSKWFLLKWKGVEFLLMWGHARLLSSATFTDMEKCVHCGYGPEHKTNFRLYSKKKHCRLFTVNQIDTASSGQMHICSVSWIENKLPVSGYCLNPP